MASILIRQFAGQSVPPTSDAILYENATTGSGVIHGCNCTASDASTIHIDAGYGIIQGRFFEIEDQTISVTLAPSGTLLGQLYIHLDLSDADTPIDIYHEEAASLTAMTQQSGINYSNGIYEIQLCTYDVSTSTISNVTDTFPTLTSTADALSAVKMGYYNISNVVTLNSNITSNIYGVAISLGNLRILSGVLTTQGSCTITTTTPFFTVNSDFGRPAAATYVNTTFGSRGTEETFPLIASIRTDGQFRQDHFASKTVSTNYFANFVIIYSV